MCLDVVVAVLFCWGRKKRTYTKLFTVTPVFFVGVRGGVVCGGGQGDLTFFQKVIYNTDIVKILTSNLVVDYFFIAGTDNNTGTASPAMDGGRIVAGCGRQRDNVSVTIR